MSSVLDARALGFGIILVAGDSNFASRKVPLSSQDVSEGVILPSEAAEVEVEAPKGATFPISLKVSKTYRKTVVF